MIGKIFSVCTLILPVAISLQFKLLKMNYQGPTANKVPCLVVLPNFQVILVLVTSKEQMAAILNENHWQYAINEQALRNADYKKERQQ
jgi:hypothetical protein